MTPIEAHFFFREKRNGPHPKEKSLSGIVQSTPIPGAVKYCDHCAVLLPGVTPCVCAAFGADVPPLEAPASGTQGRRPEGVRMRFESIAGYRRRRAVGLPAFSHRSPAPGAGLMRPGFGRAFFFGSPKPFLFGPLQKEMGSGNSAPFLISPVQGRGRDHFFFGEICLPR